MSTSAHSGKEDLAFVANYYKAMVIPRTPDDFVVAERFRHGLTDDEIRAGIAAFREFLYMLFDKLAADKDAIDVETGKKYELYGDIGAQGNGKICNCFPVFIDLALMLFSLGTHGKLEIGLENKLVVRGGDLFTVICPVTEKYHSFIKMRGARKAELRRLLSDLGLRFHGADFFGEVDFAKTGVFSITSDRNGFFPVGLKLIAEATANNRDYIKIENLFDSAFLRCDFYPLANATPKKHAVKITEYANGQPPQVRKWIGEIDALLTGSGCTVTNNLSCESIYTKPKLKNRMGMVCKIYMDITGCFITPGVNHFANPNNIAGMLPDSIANLVKAKAERECGWCAHSRRLEQCKPGCPFKFTRQGVEYEKCRYAEFRIPLDDAENRKWVRKWIEMELECAGQL